jgi:bromodomain and PHD finger-containing protein 1
LTYAEAQRLVQFELQSGPERLLIEDEVVVEALEETPDESLEVSKVADEEKKVGEEAEIENEGMRSGDIHLLNEDQAIDNELEDLIHNEEGGCEVKGSAAEQPEVEQPADSDDRTGQPTESKAMEVDASTVSADADGIGNDESAKKCSSEEPGEAPPSEKESALSQAPSPRPTSNEEEIAGDLGKAQETPKKSGQTPKARKTPKNNRRSQQSCLPKADFRPIEGISKRIVIEVEPAEFRKFEITPIEELEEAVEYDMDEEDCEWLKVVNEQRENAGAVPVSDQDFELLMDRLEKESCFESHHEGNQPEANIDENAVCCICQDGECQNSNAILFCDMCNMAVHQECYGVPYIPEGQWLCRQCLHSPSQPVDCCLCPNKGGAFKQTDDGRWAHVVCALWIPEVGFANPVFLEPIDGICEIPPARWRLNCCICRRCQGAAIQCVRPNCYTAFHPTCAQQAGLYLKIEPATDSRTGEPTVRKVALCDVHTQLDSGCPPTVTDVEAVGDENDETVSPTRRRSNALLHDKIRQQAQENFKMSRRLLEERGKQPTPVVSVPRVSLYRLGKIASQVTMTKKLEFVMRLQAYWMLKRQSRSGVPLLRRLQASQQLQRSATEKEEEVTELKKYIQQWQLLRQDLERAQLLLELIQKREKLKKEILIFQQQVASLKLDPFTVILQQMVNLLKTRDSGKVFSKPVSIDEVPDYLDVIDNPMDLSTMETKVKEHEYSNINEFVSDFDLMVNNAMIYNGKDTYYFRAAMKMRETGGAVIRAFKQSLVQIGIDDRTGMHTKEPPCVTEEVLEEEPIPTTSARPDLPIEGQLKDLQKKLVVAQSIRHQGARVQRIKQLKKEIALIRKLTGKDKEVCNILDKSPPNPEKLSSKDFCTSPTTCGRRSLRGPAPQPGSEEEKESKRIHWNFIDIGVRRWMKEQQAVQKLRTTSETDDSRDEDYSPIAMDADAESSGDEQNDNTKVRNVEENDSRYKTEKDKVRKPKRTSRSRILSELLDESDSVRKEEQENKNKTLSHRSNSYERTLVTNGPTVQPKSETQSPTPSPSNREQELERSMYINEATEEATEANETGPKNAQTMEQSVEMEEMIEGSRKKRRGRPPKRKSPVSPMSSAKRPCLEDEVFGENRSKVVRKGNSKQSISNGIEVGKRSQTPNGLRLSTSPDVEVLPTATLPSPQSTSSNPLRTLSTSSTDSKDSTLSPLTLVWAKCRGYPSYPALV